jgi:hypothetical protein
MPPARTTSEPVLCDGPCNFAKSLPNCKGRLTARLDCLNNCQALEAIVAAYGSFCIEAVTLGAHIGINESGETVSGELPRRKTRNTTSSCISRSSDGDAIGWTIIHLGRRQSEKALRTKARRLGFLYFVVLYFIFHFFVSYFPFKYLRPRPDAPAFSRISYWRAFWHRSANHEGGWAMSVRDLSSHKEAPTNDNFSDVTFAVSRNSIGSGWRTLASVLTDLEEQAERQRLAAANTNSKTEGQSPELKSRMCVRS